MNIFIRAAYPAIRYIFFAEKAKKDVAAIRAADTDRSISAA